jgi:circadian clock protein KaiB
MTEAVIQLVLYVHGTAPSSLRARRHVEGLCRLPWLRDHCELCIIDVAQHPDIAEQERILATPTLVKVGAPMVRVIGDLADQANLLLLFDLQDPAGCGGAGGSAAGYRQQRVLGVRMERSAAASSQHLVGRAARQSMRAARVEQKRSRKRGK